MRFSFLPTESVFYELFAKSADHLVEGVGVLTALVDGDRDLEGAAARIKDVEHRCDEITHEVIRRLNSTFVTPFDREDIYRLASALDDVMDDMNAAVDYIHLHEVDQLPPGVPEQVEVLRAAADLTAAAMPRLKTFKDLDEYWIEVNRLENVGDGVYRKALVHLFSGQYDALTVMRLRDVVEQLEAAIDSFENVANIVEQIAVKES